MIATNKNDANSVDTCVVVTGAAGFIGANIIKGLNARGITNIIAVDDLTQGDKFLQPGRSADRRLCGCQSFLRTLRRRRLWQS